MSFPLSSLSRFKAAFAADVNDDDASEEEEEDANKSPPRFPRLVARCVIKGGFVAPTKQRVIAGVIGIMMTRRWESDVCLDMCQKVFRVCRV